MGMWLQPISYRGRTVAAATRERFFLCDELDRRAACDPERTFVVLMCAYAGDVGRGVLPGPYRDEEACRYARAALIPGELLERPGLDMERAAVALGVPVGELRAACSERQLAPSRPMPPAVSGGAAGRGRSSPGRRSP